MRVLFRRKLRKTQANFQQNVCFYLLVGWVLLLKKMFWESSLLQVSKNL